MGSACGRVGPGGGVGGLVLCCPFGTAMGWPSRAGPRAGLSPLRERAAPPPGVPGARPAAPRPGPRGPGPDLQVKWTPRAPVAPGPGRVFKSSGRRGLRSLRARTSSPSRVDVVDADASGPTSSPSRQPDAEPMLLVRGSPRHTDVAPTERGPAGRCAAAGGVTWRPRGPAGDRVLTVGSTPGVVTASWGTKGDAVPPRASAPWLHGGPPLLPPSCLADSGSTGVVE